MAISTVDRFWAKVSKSEGCWEWTASKRRGYGCFGWKGHVIGSHRVSYELARGEIPEGMHVDHMCHNPGCVRPDHLRLATAKQNNENFSGRTSVNTSGVRGVSWDKKNKKWQALVKHNGVRLYVGRYDDLAVAEAAVRAKRNQLHTHNDLDRVA